MYKFLSLAVVWCWIVRFNICMHAPTEPFVNGWDFWKHFPNVFLFCTESCASVLCLIWYSQPCCLNSGMIVFIKIWNTPVTSRWNGRSLLHLPPHPHKLQCWSQITQSYFIYFKYTACFTTPHHPLVRHIKYSLEFVVKIKHISSHAIKIHCSCNKTKASIVITAPQPSAEHPRLKESWMAYQILCRDQRFSILPQRCRRMNNLVPTVYMYVNYVSICLFSL